jgi:DNA repair exonuclease SbcCD ATPase subunit
MQTQTEKQQKITNRFKNVLLVLLGFTFLTESYIIYRQFQEQKELKTDRDTKIANAELNFIEIENNLTEISKREGDIFSTLSETEYNALTTIQDRIKMEINSISRLMEKNHKLIDELTATIDEKDERIVRFKKSINALDKRIKEYKERTESLTSQTETLRSELQASRMESASIAEALQSKNTELEVKSKTISEQAAAIEKRDKEKRTAYYAVGTFKELKNKNVLSKEGSFLGLAGAKALKDDFDHNYFNKIDIYSYTSIPVFSKDAEVVTNHSMDSYELVMGDNEEIQYIKITDQDKFWENSKYLVVVVEK